MGNNELLINKGFLTKVDGTRIYLMDLAKVPRGWVVDARRDDPLWKYMKPGVIPLRPQVGQFGVELEDANKAEDHLKKLKSELNDPDAFVVMVPYSDKVGEWWMRPVRPADLKRDDPRTLLGETLMAIHQRKYLLADALETACRVRTGIYNLKTTRT